MADTPVMDHEQQFQLLSSEILHFIRKPGERLSENDLCQRFGLSRTPVRSLLQRLQENGLVQIVPRRGSMVTRLDLDVINQLIYERAGGNHGSAGLYSAVYAGGCGKSPLPV